MKVDELIEQVVKLGLWNIKEYMEFSEKEIILNKAEKLISFANHLSDLVDKGIVKGRTEI